MRLRLLELRASDVGRPVSHFARRFSGNDFIEDVREVLQRLVPRTGEVVGDDDRMPREVGDHTDGDGVGDIIIGAMYQRDAFTRADTILVYLILAGYSIGLLASTATRLYSSALYALNDTKTPAKIAVVRVVVSTAVAIPLMLVLDQFGVAETLGLPAPHNPLWLDAARNGLADAELREVAVTCFTTALDAVAPDLGGLTFGIAGLGDRAYEPFYQVAAVRLAVAFAELGARPAVEPLEIDGAVSPTNLGRARSWADEVAAAWGRL